MNKSNRKVPIENILYMFSYVWNRVEYIDKINLSNQDSFDSLDIFCELFVLNMKDIFKIGLYKEYDELQEEIRGIKGKVNFKESINHMSFQNAKAICEYDSLEINNKINQIIKSVAYRLYKTKGISKAHKNELNTILLYLNQVDLITIQEEDFQIQFHRHNYYTYYMIMICKLIFESTMLSEERGQYQFIDILDDDKKMEKIFELFIYKFYEKKLKNQYEVSYQKIIKWNVKTGDKQYVPQMKLDIVLKNNSNTIIIDTKYYPKFFNARPTIYNGIESKKYHEDNLYQIFSYMSQLNANSPISGILLYPVSYSKDEISAKHTINITNQEAIEEATLQIQTINLAQNWKKIEDDLLGIIDKHQ